VKAAFILLQRVMEVMFRQPLGRGPVPVREKFVTGPCRIKAKLLQKLQVALTLTAHWRQRLYRCSGLKIKWKLCDKVSKRLCPSAS